MNPEAKPDEGSFLHPSVLLAMFAILLFSPLLTLFFLAGMVQQKRVPRRSKNRSRPPRQRAGGLPYYGSI